MPAIFVPTRTVIDSLSRQFLHQAQEEYCKRTRVEVHSQDVLELAAHCHRRRRRDARLDSLEQTVRDSFSHTREPRLAVNSENEIKKYKSKFMRII